MEERVKRRREKLTKVGMYVSGEIEKTLRVR